jgi:hypothetical protein
VKHLLWPGNTE